MNERIRNIETLAWEQVQRTDGLVRTDDFLQKFAELMANKVDDILLLEQLDCIGNHDKKSAELVEQIRVKMKTYFGVD